MHRIRDFVAAEISKGAQICGRTFIEKATAYYRNEMGIKDGEPDHATICAIVVEEIAAAMGEPVERTETPVLLTKSELKTIAAELAVPMKPDDDSAKILDGVKSAVGITEKPAEK